MPTKQEPTAEEKAPEGSLGHAALQYRQSMGLATVQPGSHRLSSADSPKSGGTTRTFVMSDAVSLFTGGHQPEQNAQEA